MTNQILKALEAYRGKGIFYDTVGPTATGAATTARVAIDAEYSVPSAARELAGVIPTMLAEVPAPAESILTIGDIIGADFKGIPCEFPFPVAAGKLGAIDQLETTPMEFWPIHAPLKGTEDLNFGQEQCDALAGNGQAGLTLVFLEKPSGFGQIYGKFSREISGSTTAAYVAEGTDIKISNALKMYEMVAIAVCGGVVTTLQELAAKATMKCSVWDPIQTQEFFLAPIHAIEATTGVATVKQIMRMPLDAKFKTKNAVVETTIEQYDAMTVAPMYAHGVRWYGSK